MKTYIFTALITALFNPAYFFAHVPACQFNLDEESYVEDIDFNTERVVSVMATKMTEEAYVDDIPFNTSSVAMNLGTSLPEEAYVDDIPFNTYEVAVNGKVSLPEEAYVDDIPFDTECVVNNRHMRNGLLAKCLIKKDGEPTSSVSTHDGSRHDMAMKKDFMDSK